MNFRFLNGEIKYDGSQLHSHFAYEHGVKGNSIVSFIGPAEVKEHLVDCEDRLKNDFISSESMLHFIIEIFDVSLREMVVWQRLFITQTIDFLKSLTIPESYKLRRVGDDIFVDSKKLSVSIATLSPVSGLIHVGLNIKVGENCPVLAIGLEDLPDLGYDVKCFAIMLMKKFIEEFEDIQNDCYKVKGVQ